MSAGLKIQEILDEAGISTKQTRRSVVTDCPVPTCDGEMKLYIEKSNGRSICFKCNTRWNPTAVLSAILRVSNQEAHKMIFSGEFAEEVENGIELEIDEMKSQFDDDLLEDEIPDIKEIVLDPLFIPVEESETGMAYLAKRGISDVGLIRAHDIRYSATMNAVVFVIRDERGRIVGTQARYINPVNPKIRMVTSSGLNKARVLYNLSSREEENLILVEGPFDCLKTDLPGYLSVASLGKGVSEQQIKMILNSKSKNIFLGLDKDAFKEVKGLAERLIKTKRVFRLMPPDHRGDFGDCTREEVIEAIGRADLLHDGEMRLEVFVK